jgi:DNA integrity scanning protein DisA with diadenylate cyclase activity
VNFIFALELFVNIDMLFDLILRLIGKRKVFWLSWYTVADFSVTIVSWIALILTWLETAVIVEFSFKAIVFIIAMRVISTMLRIAVIIKNQVLSVRANKHKIEVDAIGPDFLASHGLNEVSHEMVQLDLDKLSSSTVETTSQTTSARNSFDIVTQKLHNTVELSELRHARMKEALLESCETFEDEFVMRMTGEV